MFSFLKKRKKLLEKWREWNRFIIAYESVRLDFPFSPASLLPDVAIFLGIVNGEVYERAKSRDLILDFHDHKVYYGGFRWEFESGIKEEENSFLVKVRQIHPEFFLVSLVEKPFGYCEKMPFIFFRKDRS